MTPSVPTLSVLFLFFLSANVYAYNSYNSSCEKSSCYPATGDLLIGRKNDLVASSTCGLEGWERFCIVNQLNNTKCAWCFSALNAKANLSHRIENIVRTLGSDTNWWQSKNGVENVTIQLNLESEFHFTHLVIKFKTFRPAAMLIERSHDFGKTWRVYRYFASDCDSAFPGIPKEQPVSLTQVFCDQRYSSVSPSENGEVILKIMPSNNIRDPYSQDVQNLLKMTNLRINFTKLHTLGDDLLDKRNVILEKYYYAIKEMVVRGSCSCYGHASRCLPTEKHSSVTNEPGMVHGKCDCTHNTKGRNCEECEDFFNDFPWKPALGKQKNECKRCNCNNHATKCHFDETVFNSTGQMSGGVCDECADNTTGRNCEQCKQYFYQDPKKLITDSDVCLPCDCDPGGSLDDGICDSKTDLVNGLEAGRCHCKTNVEGRRCDTCKNGFWDINESNPDGCQECTCHPQGTVKDQGCNNVTGECTCKRYVTGRNCDECISGYWGLSDSQFGCEPCDCDGGGAYDPTTCDMFTGQCKCRRHLSGRKCNVIKENFYVPTLDTMISEAELSHDCKNDCQVYIQEPYRDGRNNTWTGTGFMKLFDESELVMDIKNIPITGPYEIVLRYDNQGPNDYSATVNLERTDPIDSNGTCADYEQYYNAGDIRNVLLTPVSKYTTILPPVCLEAKKNYKTKIHVQRFNKTKLDPSASILIDSVVLIPHIDESVPFVPLNKQNLEEYINYKCNDAFYSVLREHTIPDICKKYHYSIGFYYLDGASACYCDPTGSISASCDSLGGQCSCKTNVVGRKCDRCAPGTYGFSPEGCRACDCNSVGALDNFCDVKNGQCKCHPRTYGRECNKCEPGSWGYPNCKRCECNGHTDECDSHTGECLKCQSFTEGHYCDRCIEGYYGDPRLRNDTIEIPCRPCSCPDTAESGHYFAHRCTLVSETEVNCECKEGYKGPKCDMCDENYFGNPEVSGGSCQQCNCNNNVDITKTGNCDPHTGKCLQCLYDTEGENCEVCKTGYFGDAINQTCAECVCNFLGSKSSVCNHTTGQCPCHPNVVGLSCDACEPRYWKIASGSGCVPCNCDPTGSSSEECNEFDGQCKCKPGFGGTQCNQCTNNYWGNPVVKCYACDCNREGSQTQQCNGTTGHCNCKPGIGGEKCDTCARGYHGIAPNCESCGPCFENWDKVQKKLIEQTEMVIKSAFEIKNTGVPGAYKVEFFDMEKKITDAELTLQTTTNSSYVLQTLQKDIEQLSINVTTIEQLNAITNTIYNAKHHMYLANLTLEDLHNKTITLKNTTNDLKQNLTKLQELNVEGALNITKEASQKAEILKNKTSVLDILLQEVETQCRNTELYSSRNVDNFNTSIRDNELSLEKLNEKMNNLNQEIPKLNQQTCGRRSENCDKLCGGAGCGFCGGLSCESGAITIAERAFKFAQDAEKDILDKESKAEELIRGMSQANLDLNSTLVYAKDIGNQSETAKKHSQNILNESYALIERYEKFLNRTGIKSEDVEKKVAEVLKLNITFNTEQLKQLSRDINKMLSQPMNIDNIISDTTNDLASAELLNKEAENKKLDAITILNNTESVENALAEAENITITVSNDTLLAKQNIEDASNSLSEVDNETKRLHETIQDLSGKINGTENKLKILQTGFLKNVNDADDVKSNAKILLKNVKETNEAATKLFDNYTKVNETLKNHVENSTTILNNTTSLLDKASKLSLNTKLKLNELEDADMAFKIYEDQMSALRNQTDELNQRMNNILEAIKDKVHFYNTCSK